MRRTAARLLNVLPGAVIVASMIAMFTVPAEAAGRVGPPVPYVVAIDPGHGGSPDNNHPDQLFDPGSVAGNGLVEKDLTLDIARRLERRLGTDQVKVVLTRSSDRFVPIPDRMATATSASANLFVSVHLNFFQDPGVGGTVVLFPREADRAYAQVMSDALDHRLGKYKVPSNGLMLRESLWAHAPMPAVTVEAAYLTNKAEADLLATDKFKEAIAAGLATGIETQLPGIPARKAEILRLRAASAAQARSAAIPLPVIPAATHVPVVKLAILCALAAALVRYRRATIPALAFTLALGSVLRARASGRVPDPRTRRGVRRRRSRAPLWTGAPPY